MARYIVTPGIVDFVATGAEVTAVPPAPLNPIEAIDEPPGATSDLDYLYDNGLAPDLAWSVRPSGENAILYPHPTVAWVRVFARLRTQAGRPGPPSFLFHFVDNFSTPCADVELAAGVTESWEAYHHTFEANPMSLAPWEPIDITGAGGGRNSISFFWNVVIRGVACSQLYLEVSSTSGASAGGVLANRVRRVFDPGFKMGGRNV